MSRVEGRGWRVEGGGWRVEGRVSRVEGKIFFFVRSISRFSQITD